METQSTINTANLCHIIRFYLQEITNTDEPAFEEQQAKAEGLIKKPQRYYLGTAYLTTREIQCVKLLMKNKTMQAIGDSLGLSKRTIEFYMNNIRQRFSLNNRAQMIEYFKRLDKTGMN